LAIAVTQGGLQSGAEGFNPRPASAYDYARSSSMHFQVNLVSFALNPHAGDASIAEIFGHILPDFPVFLQQFWVVFGIGIPPRAMLLGNPQSKTNWMNFLSHRYFLKSNLNDG
jgi:hypothetical protein